MKAYQSTCQLQHGPRGRLLRIIFFVLLSGLSNSLAENTVAGMGTFEKFIAFHGSPGDFHDFDVFLESGLLPVEPPMEVSMIEPAEKHVTVLGYSWGSYNALKYTIENKHRVKNLIFLCPYLILPAEKDQPSLLTRILASPLGPLLIRLKMNSILEDFLTKTAAPDSVPSVYRQSVTKYADVERIRASALEKLGKHAEILSLLGQLKQSGIPVSVVFGLQDQVVEGSDQVKKLKAILQIKNEIGLPGGHALMWTRTNDVVAALEKIIRE